jgi:hypothetical protein
MAEGVRLFACQKRKWLRAVEDIRYGTDELVAPLLRQSANGKHEPSAQCILWEGK